MYYIYYILYILYILYIIYNIYYILYIIYYILYIIYMITRIQIKFMYSAYNIQYCQGFEYKPFFTGNLIWNEHKHIYIYMYIYIIHSSFLFAECSILVGGHIRISQIGTFLLLSFITQRPILPEGSLGGLITFLFVYFFFILGPYSEENLSIPLFFHMAQSNDDLMTSGDEQALNMSFMNTTSTQYELHFNPKKINSAL